MSDSGFPDLRAFLDRLRTRRRARASWTRRGRRTPRSGRDPPPRHRGRRAGAPLHACPRRRASRSSRTCSARARRAELAFGRRPGRLDRAASSSWPRRCCRRPPGKLWGGARRRSTRAAARRAAPRASGPVTEVVTTTSRLDRLPVLTSWPEDGGPFLTLPLVYTEHPRAEAPGAQPRHLPHAGPRRADDRHALADRQGGRLPLRRGRGARRGAAGDGVPRRPAGADPRGDRAAARERARAAARLAARRRAAAGSSRAGAAPARRRGRVRARRPRPAAARQPGRARSATTTATTRCATTTRSSRSRRSPPHATRSTPRRSSASRARRTSSSATSCRTCSRRSSRS